MKKIFFLLGFIFIVITTLRSQDMKLPPANNNALFNQFVGTWVSEPYEMMGAKWVDEAEFKWILNNQFLEMNVVTKGDNGFSFKSYSIMSVDKEGKYKCWGFDEWGSLSAAYYEGKVDGNRLTYSGGSDFMKGKSDMLVEGNIASQELTFTMKDEQGKETTSTMKLTYNKIK